VLQRISDRFAFRGRGKEQIDAVKALLASFAEDIEAHRRNEDMMRCARLIERVRGLAGVAK